jgi:cytoskeletal protein RodZ
MLEYIILVGVVAVIAVGAFRVFGGRVKATIEHERDSVASINASDGSEGQSTRSSASSHSSQSSTASKSNTKPGSSHANTDDRRLASEGEQEEVDGHSAWRLVFIGVGVVAVAILLFRLSRLKQSSSG